MKNKMRKGSCLIAVFCILLVSCRDALTERNQQLLIGDWVPVNDTLTNWPPSLPRFGWYNWQGYRFMEGNLCDNKVGFYDYFHPNGVMLCHASDFPDEVWFCGNPIEPEVQYEGILRYPSFRGQYNYKSKVYFYLYNVKRSYGNRTGYRVEGDSVKIYNPALKQWVGYRMAFHGLDSMKLFAYSDSLQEWYIRKEYTYNNKPLLDAMVFYIPPTCVSGDKSFCLQRDGRLTSYGCFEKDKFFLARMPAGEFERIETLFKQADLADRLKSHDSLQHLIKYTGFFSFQPIATFARGNQISSLPVSLRAGGDELYWAYLSGLFSLDQMALEATCYGSYSRVFSEFDDFYDIRIYKKQVELLLAWPKLFYLGVLLSQAPEVELDFDPVYRLTGFKDKKKEMQTDGRYFSYMRDGRKVILDIGFNFIEENRLEKEE